MNPRLGWPVFTTAEMEGKILGVNTRAYPSFVEDYVEVSVVLVAGAIGDYAAYVGSGPPEWIAKYGNKVSFEEAQMHFPLGLDREKYRV